MEAYVQRRKIPEEIKEAQGHNSYEVIYEQEVPEPELINLAEIKEKGALNELVENITRESLFFTTLPRRTTAPFRPSVFLKNGIRTQISFIVPVRSF